MGVSTQSSDHYFKTDMMIYLRKCVSVDENLPELYDKNLVWLSCQELFNLLNQENAQGISKLSDKNYLLLLDTRSREEYNAGHMLLAKSVKKTASGDFMLPFGTDIECKRHIVVYDTFTSPYNPTDPAIKYADTLSKLRTRRSIKILKGGYAEFCKCYPDYRTTQILYTPQEIENIATYPIEIVPNFLFLGSFRHAESEEIHTELKIKAHVNYSRAIDPFFLDMSCVYHIEADEFEIVNLINHFEPVCEFLGKNFVQQQVVLVYSAKGLTNATAFIIAYLMKSLNYPLQRAFDYVKDCKTNINPTLHCMEQLVEWEKTCYTGPTINTNAENVFFTHG